MFRVTVLILAAVVALASSAAHNGIFNKRKPMPDGRIIGGQLVDIVDYPYQFSLQWRGSHFCGGSILNTRFGATAAHCTEEDDAADNELTIRVGSSRRNEGGSVYAVDWILEHPSYDTDTIAYDFSIIRVSTPIVFGVGVQPIPLHPAGATVAVGAELWVSGWGVHREIDGDINDLRSVSVYKVDQAVCDAAYQMWDGVSDDMLCAAYEAGGRDACQGDSGGPLVDKSTGLLVGVVSWGYGCAEVGFPGVYGRVAHVTDWFVANSQV